MLLVTRSSCCRLHSSWSSPAFPSLIRSIEINEQSGNAGGLPQWPSEGTGHDRICALLFVQGLSELIKRIAVMRNLIPDPHAATGPALETEAEELSSAIEKH